jgi:hypothetical protein
LPYYCLIVYGYYCILLYDTVLSGTWVLTFEENMLLKFCS